MDCEGHVSLMQSDLLPGCQAESAVHTGNTCALLQAWPTDQDGSVLAADELEKVECEREKACSRRDNRLCASHTPTLSHFPLSTLICC
eukprot:1149343-Pelagomonas_calceolata.AAC.2